MSAAAVFLYGALAVSGGALAFLTGQRSSGRTDPDVARCYENVRLLEGVAGDLATLADEAREAGDEDGLKELETALSDLEDAIAGLRRGADAVV